MIHKKKVLHIEIIADNPDELEAFYRENNSEFHALRGLEINTKRFFIHNQKIVYLHVVDLRSMKAEKVNAFIKWARELEKREPTSQILIILPSTFVTFPDLSIPGAYKSAMRKAKFNCRKIHEEGIIWYHRCVFKHFVNVPTIQNDVTWYAIGDCYDVMIDCDFEERLIHLTLALLELEPYA